MADGIVGTVEGAIGIFVGAVVGVIVGEAAGAIVEKLVGEIVTTVGAIDGIINGVEVGSAVVGFDVFKVGLKLGCAVARKVVGVGVGFEVKFIEIEGVTNEGIAVGKLDEPVGSIDGVTPVGNTVENTGESEASEEGAFVESNEGMMVATAVGMTELALDGEEVGLLINIVGYGIDGSELGLFGYAVNSNEGGAKVETTTALEGLSETRLFDAATVGTDCVD